MLDRGGRQNYLFFGIYIFLTLLAIVFQAVESCFAFSIKFSQGTSWGVQQKTEMTYDRDENTSIGASSATCNFALTVLKTYTNGSALVRSIKEEFDNNVSENFLLISSDGKIFKLRNTYAGVIEKSGLENDLIFLKMVKNTDEWMAKNKPIDCYKIPGSPILVGGSEKILIGEEEWRISRLPDELFGNTKAQVYLSSPIRHESQVYENIWISAEEGKILKRVLFRKGQASLKIEELAGPVDERLLKSTIITDKPSPAIPEDVITASELILSQLAEIMEKTVKKIQLNITDIVIRSVKEDPTYDKGPFTGELVASIGWPNKAKLTHNIKISVRVNPRNETRDFFGTRTTPDHQSFLIVRNDIAKIIRVYVSDDWSKILNTQKRKVGGEGDHFLLNTHVDLSQDPKKTQSIVVNLEYTDQMKGRAQELADQLIAGGLTRLVWNQ